MSAEQTYVIVGASLAGAKAAETLRAEGFDGRLAADRRRGRAALRASAALEGVPARRGGARQGLRPRGGLLRRSTTSSCGSGAGRWTSTSPRSELALDDGERLRYDRLLLTTGAEPRRLAVPGAELDGVLYLRSVEDSDALRERLDRGGAVVVVGAGWIGAEVAASARQRGLEVTVLDPLAVPLERVLGAEVGAIYRDIHADHGTRMLMGTGVEAFEGGTAVERVRTSDGRELECDFVVVGVGVEPRTELGAKAGLTLDNGIAVDERLRTSAPAVFAAGDVANAHHPFYGERIRVEHWANALNQGPGGRAQHARRRRCVRPPALLLLGPVRRRHGVLRLRPDLGSRRPARRPREPRVHRLLVGGDRVVAGMNVNVWDVTDPIQRADPRARRGRRPAPGGHRTSRSRSTCRGRLPVSDCADAAS